MSNSRPFARRILAVLPLLAAAFPLGAQALPTPQQLAARHDSAVGGRAVLESHKSFHLTGTMAIPMLQIEAPLDVMKHKPNLYYFRAALGPMGEVVSGYDGKNAWSIQPGQPPALLTGPAAEQMVEQADFYGGLRDYSKFTSVETLDTTDFEGKRAYRIRVVRPSGDTLFEFFEMATGLSLGGSANVVTAMGKVEARTVLSDYKDFGGMKMATRIVQKAQAFESILLIKDVVFDSLDESKLAPPDAIKALIKP